MYPPKNVFPQKKLKTWLRAWVQLPNQLFHLPYQSILTATTTKLWSFVLSFIIVKKSH